MIVYFRVLRESINFAVSALVNNKLRTFLSLLGVTIGIFSIIAVLAAVDSLKSEIQDSLKGLDNSTIYLGNFLSALQRCPVGSGNNFPQRLMKNINI